MQAINLIKQLKKTIAAFLIEIDLLGKDILNKRLYTLLVPNLTENWEWPNV